MFGLGDIKREIGLFLRDTNDTYAQEISLCWEEMLRNLPREQFSINLARDVPFKFKARQEIYTLADGLPDIQLIHSIRYEWGTIWLFLQRVPMNDTDIFTKGNTPESMPFYYEFAPGRLKLYPAPNNDMQAMITASLGIWNPDGGCAADCVRISDKYRTFCRYYVLALIYANILRDDEAAAQTAAALEGERAKLMTVRERQTRTGTTQQGW